MSLPFSLKHHSFILSHHYQELYSNMSSQKNDSVERPVEVFDFECHHFHSPSKLFEMKQDGFFKNRKPGNFEIGKSIDWDHDLAKALSALIELFAYFNENRIVWERLTISLDHNNQKFTRLLFHTVNNMKIFKKMSLDWRFSQHSDSEMHDDVCPGIASNTFLQELSIECGGWG